MISVVSDKRMGRTNLLVSSGVLTDVGDQVGAEGLEVVAAGYLVPDSLKQQRGVRAAF